MVGFFFCHLYLGKKIDSAIFNWPYEGKSLLLLDFYMLGGF